MPLNARRRGEAIRSAGCESLSGARACPPRRRSHSRPIPWLLLGWVATVLVARAQLPGDVDGDGRVTAVDASLALQYALDLRVPPFLESEQAADLTGNGRPDPVDASLILQTSLRIRPQVLIESSALTFVLPVRVRFTSTVTGGTPGYAYQWDLNADGVTDADTPTVEHAFAAEGAYVVTLRVTDGAQRSVLGSHTVRIDVTPPDVAVGVVATPRQGGCLLEWTPPAGEPLLGFHVYRQKAGETDFVLLNQEYAQDFWLDDFLENGVAYTYEVVAVDWTGLEGPPSATVTAIPGAAPAKPMLISAEKVGAQAVRIQWSAVSGAVGYRPLLGEYSRGFLDSVTDEAVAGTTHTFEDLPLDGSLYFGVEAIDAWGSISPRSEPAWVLLLSSETDSNADGIPDAWCGAFGLSPTVSLATNDFDGDGLNALQEYQALTHPFQPDTDGDGATDGLEVLIHHSNPVVMDTDAGGMTDDKEITMGLDPTVAADDLAAAPSGLRVFRLRGRKADLIWEVAPDARVAGYNVYLNQGQGFQKINASLVTQTQFTTAVLPLDTDLTLAVRSVLPDQTEGLLSRTIRLRLRELDFAAAEVLELDGNRLHVPAGAVSVPTTVAMASSALESGLSPSGNALDLLPHGLTFLAPCTLALSFDATDLDPALVGNLTLVALSGDRWLPLSNVTVSTSNNQVQGEIEHFSTYSVTYEAEGEFKAFDLVQNQDGVLSANARWDSDIDWYWLLKAHGYFYSMVLDFEVPIYEVECDTASRHRIWKEVKRVKVRRSMEIDLSPWYDPDDPDRGEYRLHIRIWSSYYYVGFLSRYSRPTLEVSYTTWLRRDAEGIAEIRQRVAQYWGDLSMPVGTGAQIGLKADRCYLSWIQHKAVYDINAMGERLVLEGASSSRSALTRVNSAGTLGPVFTYTGPTAVWEDNPYNFVLRATSPLRSALQFTAQVGDPNVAVYSSGGTVTFSPRNQDVNPGLPATYEARDNRGNITRTNLLLTVHNTEDNPRITQAASANRRAVIPRQAGSWNGGVQPHETITLSIAADDDDLINGDRLTYTWTADASGWEFSPADARGYGTGAVVTLIPPALTELQRRMPDQIEVICTVTDSTDRWVASGPIIVSTKYWTNSTAQEPVYVEQSHYTYVNCHNSTTDWTACGSWPLDGNDPHANLIGSDGLHWAYSPIWVFSHYQTVIRYEWRSPP